MWIHFWLRLVKKEVREMLGCNSMEHLGLIVGIVIGFILLYVAIHLKKKYSRDKKLRQAHLDNCEVCRKIMGKNG